MRSTIKNRRQMHHCTVAHHLMLLGAVHYLTSMRFISFRAAEVLGNCRFIFVPLRGLVSLPLRGVRILEKGSIAHPYSANAYSSVACHGERVVELELELELIQTQMTQKPMLRAEVGMRVRCANKASAE